MRNFIKPVFIAVFLICQSGCATFANGTSQKILAISMPPGARILVDGNKEFTTPATLRLERRRDHVLLFSKNGYRDETVKVMHVISEAVAGNTLIFGPLGWAVDALNGCQYKLVPATIHIDMKPEDGRAGTYQ